MSKKTETTQQQPEQKSRLVGNLTYLPYRAKGYGTRIGPVFSTSREDCRSVLIESIPLDLVRDIQRGEVGSFFLWETKDEAGA